jgi:hypothetical protein
MRRWRWWPSSVFSIRKEVQAAAAAATGKKKEKERKDEAASHRVAGRTRALYNLTNLFLALPFIVVCVYVDW